MKNREYIEILNNIVQNMDEGVHVVDAEGTSIVYNRAMAALEKMESKEVLRKPFAEIFKNLNPENSTLLKALYTGRATEKKEQTYLNKDGKQITTVNTTIPVSADGKVIAAIEIAKDITDIQRMSTAILDLRKEIEAPRHERGKFIRKYTFGDILGENYNFKKVVGYAKKLAKSSAPVLIYGETGTGKELFAQSIHYASERADKPFIAQNCAAVPAGLLEGLLFGTSKGGFTGSVDRPGLFEQADGGTLLLDEINSLPQELQSKLLRVLQENYIRRVGGKKDIPVDVRIIATTNEHAADLVEDGRLRSDLYFRIAVMQLEIPALRERRDDIVFLAEKFMDKYNEKFGRRLWMLSEKAIDKLMSYDYPGNVRELENIIMSAVSLAELGDYVLDEDELVINRRKSIAAKQVFELGEGGLDEYLQRIELEMIEHALSSSGGNITRAAEKLRLSRQDLQYKIKKYKLKQK